MDCDSGKHKFYNPIKEGPRYIALSAKPEKLSKYLKLNRYIEYC